MKKKDCRSVFEEMPIHDIRFVEEVFGDPVVLRFSVCCFIDSLLIEFIYTRIRIGHQDRGMRSDNELGVFFNQLMDQT